MFGAILMATNSFFQKGMKFCRSVYVKKVMKLLAFIFEQPSYFLRKKLNITEIKKLVNKYCQFLQFMTNIIMCKNPPFYANFLTL